MLQISRRMFLGQTVAGLTVAGMASAVEVAEKERRFTMDLVCGAIGVKANQKEAIRLAALGGFESVQPSPQELAGLDAGQLDEMLALLKENNLVWGAAGMPVDFRKDDGKFATGISELPKLAAALQKAGGSRMSTWLSPGHSDLTYVSNFRQHARRLREVAKILGDHGQRFGLEYVGPKTSWTKQRHPFVHTMAEARELIAEIGEDNVGLVLDSWHWYTAQETKEDLLSLTNQDVVACDLNDAPAGLAVDEQMDLQRALPASTGVIDVKTFLEALVQIGYDGPVRAEPFSKDLNAMDNEDAIAATSAAMRTAFSMVE